MARSELHRLIGEYRKPDRLIILIALGLIAALAWWWLVARANVPMAMDSGMAMSAGQSDVMPIVTQAYGPLALMWAIMMVAMMLPSASPVIMLYASMGRARQGGVVRPGTVCAFVAGYLVIWLLLALVAAAIEVGLHRALLLSPAMASTDQALSGGLLIAAGLYQWSALKRVCLAKCQSPIGFLLSHWRDGPRGAFRMGGAHGLYCLGCCWLLMALLFVAGVMNLIWIAALSGVVLLEKILPLGPWPARLSGLAMIGGGAYLLLAKAFG